MERRIALKLCRKFLALAVLTGAAFYAAESPAGATTCNTAYEECYHNCYSSANVQTCQMNCQVSRQACEEGGGAGGTGGSGESNIYSDPSNTGRCTITLINYIYSSNYNACMQGSRTEYCPAGDADCCDAYATGRVNGRCG